MKIEIVVDPSRPAPPASLAARVAPAAAAAGVPTEGARFVKSTDIVYSLRLIRFLRGGGRPRRGRGGGRRKNERPNKSVADLDAEMEVRPLTSSVLIRKPDVVPLSQDYTASNAPAAA